MVVLLDEDDISNLCNGEPLADRPLMPAAEPSTTASNLLHPLHGELHPPPDIPSDTMTIRLVRITANSRAPELKIHQISDFALATG